MDAIKKRLEAERDALLALEASSKDSTKPVELDQTTQGRLSRMDAMQMQAMAQATAGRRKEALQRVETALRRIEEGDYGYCVSCDEAIAPKRLELDPTILTCIQCAGGRG